jgi:hypothetical protein
VSTFLVFFLVARFVAADRTEPVRNVRIAKDF